MAIPSKEKKPTVSDALCGAAAHAGDSSTISVDPDFSNIINDEGENSTGLHPRGTKDTSGKITGTSSGAVKRFAVVLVCLCGILGAVIGTIEVYGGDQLSADSVTSGLLMTVGKQIKNGLLKPIKAVQHKLEKRKEAKQQKLEEEKKFAVCSNEMSSLQSGEKNLTLDEFLKYAYLFLFFGFKDGPYCEHLMSYDKDEPFKDRFHNKKRKAFVHHNKFLLYCQF